MNYAVCGSGCASVVYLHCMGGHLGTWQRLWDELDTGSYRHVGLDFRGHGDSMCSPCEVTNERLSRDVLKLGDALGLDRFAVVGHSLGGKVATMLAAMAADRVLGLALIGAPGPGPVPLRREDVAGFMAAYHDVAVTEAFFRPWIKVQPNAAVDDWIRSFSALPGWALHAAAEISLWTDISDAVRGANVPALLIAGEDDPIYGPAYQQQEVASFLPGGAPGFGAWLRPRIDPREAARDRAARRGFSSRSLQARSRGADDVQPDGPSAFVRQVG